MNEQDKQAFDNWLKTKQWIGDHAKMWWCLEAWEVACEYARNEHKFNTPPAVFVYEDMYKEQLNINKKLQAENAKLKETLSKIETPKN